MMMINGSLEAVRVPPAGLSPYHAGEEAMQARAGWRDRVREMGRRMIRDFMPDQHRVFFAQLPLLFVGSLDAQDRPWASVLVGQPGFAASPDEHTLRVDAHPLPGDPLPANLIDGAPVGLLGIQLETRRRNRLNGRLSDVRPGGFSVHVEQSFGNCPQYIQSRHPAFLADPARTGARRTERAILSDRAASLIAGADTFFIATAAADARNGGPADGVDMSHRGGKPGFVRVATQQGRTVLTAPDFRGNFAFNTLGNLAVNPRAGLLFIDFDRGDVLMLTGDATSDWDSPEIAAFAGAQRLLRFGVQEGVLLERVLPLRWSAPIAAPQLATTGSWSAIARAAAGGP